MHILHTQFKCHGCDGCGRTRCGARNPSVVTLTLMMTMTTTMVTGGAHLVVRTLWMVPPKKKVGWCGVPPHIYMYIWRWRHLRRISLHKSLENRLIAEFALSPFTYTYRVSVCVCLCCFGYSKSSVSRYVRAGSFNSNREPLVAQRNMVHTHKLNGNSDRTGLLMNVVKIPLNRREWKSSHLSSIENN